MTDDMENKSVEYVHPGVRRIAMERIAQRMHLFLILHRIESVITLGLALCLTLHGIAAMKDTTQQIRQLGPSRVGFGDDLWRFSVLAELIMLIAFAVTTLLVTLLVMMPARRWKGHIEFYFVLCAVQLIFNVAVSLDWIVGKFSLCGEILCVITLAYVPWRVIVAMSACRRNEITRDPPGPTRS